MNNASLANVQGYDHFSTLSCNVKQFCMHSLLPLEGHFPSLLFGLPSGHFSASGFASIGFSFVKQKDVLQIKKGLYVADKLLYISKTIIFKSCF